ncbi:MAG: RNA pseudouridine synthase [Treponemataceae bacterium]|nr:RNA pseudouridine synthase [Treponemataceae bacterium]
MNSLEILFENDEIRIINKPYNLPTQGGQGIKNSVDSLLEEQLGCKAYLVHRLDKETSGILVTAKNPKAAQKWTGLIAAKNVKKTYHALCFGKLNQKEGIINESISEKGCVKEARTKFKVLQTYSMDDMDFSLIELELETGRMHQIRKHLAQKNCPIIADDKYGDFKKNKFLQKEHGIKKMMLVSKKLTLPSQMNIKPIEIQYPLHFQEAVELFSKISYN